jgi:hypothetical protein
LNIQEDNHELHYTIRFQNTGTYLAENVVIRDTLPLALDILTLRMGPASHPYTYTASGNGILEFTFSGINLPDSASNEPGSHGLVSFSIEPMLPLTLGEEITNVADIYFDFNPPIHTPEATVTVTSPTGLPSAHKAPAKLFVYPVPTKNTLNAVLPEGFKPAQAWAVGVDGRRMPLVPAPMQANTMPFAMQHLAPGAYVLTLVDRDGKRMSARFTKE